MNILIYFFAILTVIFAINMLFQKKMVNVALSLMGCMASLAVLFISLYATFVGLLQLVVYAGAVMVLFLIIISIIDPFGKIKYTFSSKLWAIFTAIVGIIFGWLVYVIYKSQGVVNKLSHSKFDIKALSHRLFTVYLLPFEVISILVLIGIIGAVYFGKKNLDSGDNNGDNA